MPSRLIGRRTCSELEVRTARLLSWKLQACLVERQAEPIEQRANSCFGVGNQFLMDHPDHPARRNLVEMVHHPDIVGIEGADVGQDRS